MSVALALAVASATAQSVEFWPQGNDECPCIDPFASGNASCSVTRPSDGYCFPASYGSNVCKAHDLLGAPECVNLDENERPGWCGKSWCYIDPSNCNRPFDPSRHFPGATWSGSALSFSYETCGFVKDGTATLLKVIKAHAAKQTQGAIRVAFPSNNHFFLKTLERGEGVGGTQYSGAIPVFIDSIFRKHGIPWVEVPISNASRAASPTSGYTACTHEVALGGADMCWANFLSTAYRRSLTPFTGPVFNDDFFLIIRREKQELTFWENFIRPFGPFTWDLWIVIVLLLAYTGISLAYEERKHKSLWEFVNQVPTAMLKGINSFNGSGEVFDVERKTSGSWITTVALGFTVLVLLTAYSAVITVTLVEQSFAAVNSLEEAIRAGMSICAEPETFTGLSSLNPKIAPLLVDAATGGLSGAELEAMDQGLCDAVIVAEFQWYQSRVNNTVHCNNKVRLLETVLAIPIGMPITREINQQISSLIQEEVEGGSFPPVLNQAKLNYTAGLCPEQSATSAEVTSFDLRSMSGPLLLLFIVSTASMIVTRLGERAQCGRLRCARARSEGRSKTTFAEIC